MPHSIDVLEYPFLEGVEALSGRIHSGLIKDRQAESLSSWRVTTDSFAVAEGVAKLLGGKPLRCRKNGAQFWEVLTRCDKISIVVPGVNSVEVNMILWGIGGLAHHCDGARFISPAKVAGRPCDCPRRWEDRIARARSGVGPLPRVGVRFEISDDRSLGMFAFDSYSWKFAESISMVRKDMERFTAPCRCELSIKSVEFVSAGGKALKYRVPRIDVLGSA